MGVNRIIMSVEVERPKSVEQLLDELRHRLGARNDKELAEHIGVHKSTISTWKRRGHIPTEHLTVLSVSGGPTVLSEPVNWGTWHWYAFGFTLLRFSFAVKPLVEQQDYQDLVSVFKGSNAFFMLMGLAESKLNKAREKGDFSLETAFAMAVHDYLSDADKNAAADRETLRKYGFEVPR